MDGNLSPRQNPESTMFDCAMEDLAAGFPLGRYLGKKDVPNAVVTEVRKVAIQLVLAN